MSGQHIGGKRPEKASPPPGPAGASPRTEEHPRARAGAQEDRDTLARHQRRREQGIPTLTVLVGPPAAALSLWGGWLGEHGRPLVLRPDGDVRAGVRDWLAALDGVRPLATLAADFLVAALDEPSRHLSLPLTGRTAHERDQLLHGLAAHLPPGETSIAALRLLHPARGGHESGDAPGSLLASWEQEPLRALAAVHPLAPGPLAPALLLSGPPKEGRLEDAAHLASQLCVAVPALPVALQALPSEVDAYLCGGESQARALVREGRVPLKLRSREELERTLETLGLPRLPSGQEVLARLAEDGVPDEVLARYGEAARECVAAECSPESVDRARSSAERFLHALLEAQPETRGLFELNARAEFLLRGRPVEVDFLSRTLRLAIEVDGYHHFRGESDYRRDRRKDLALQRHGYWVLRFLAQDVVARLEDIRDTLRDVITLRRDSPGQPPSP